VWGEGLGMRKKNKIKDDYRREKAPRNKHPL
jgi:hypothetical protein